MTEDIKHVPKGWGYEKWIVNTDEYCGKLLFFNKGKRCSWHYHKIKDETFYLQSGSILLFYGDTDSLEDAKTLLLEPGDKFHIYRGYVIKWLHRQTQNCLSFLHNTLMRIVTELSLEILFNSSKFIITPFLLSTSIFLVFTF